MDSAGASSTSGADGGGGNGSGRFFVRICQICGHPAAGFYFGVLTCRSCQKFWQRHTTCDLTSLKCNVGRPYHYNFCDLSVRRPCSRCRLEKMRLFGEQRRQQNRRESSSTSSSSAASSSAGLQPLTAGVASTSSLSSYTDAVEEVKKLQTKVNIRKFITKAPSGVPLTPSNFELQTSQAILKQIMDANRDFVSAKYIYTYEYLQEHGGIPAEEHQLWQLIGLSVEDIVKGNIPFARQLAGPMIDCPSDMCRLIDASYWLMYCVQSGIIATTDVVSAFGLLFKNMLNQWPELEGMMECAQQLVQVIRVWQPQPPEFAFLMSLIFCNSLRTDRRQISPKTTITLDRLAESVTQVGRVYVNDMYGESIGEMRWKQLQIILDVAIREQTIRCDALRPFKERTPHLVRTIVHPVCSVVCTEFASVWNIEDAASELAIWPPPYNHHNPRPVIDEMVDCLLAGI